MRLAAPGLSYTQAGQGGWGKSARCRWLRRWALLRPRLPEAVGELDGLGRRTRQGAQGLKALREATGAVLAAFGSGTAAQGYACQIMELREGTAAYWLDQALTAGRQYWTTGAVADRTTSRWERYNRELGRRKCWGTVWSEHNRLALLQIRGLLNQIT